jgi:predicted transcriptional regulator
MSRKLVIRVGDIDADAAAFIDAWHRAERGEDVADFSLTFESMGGLIEVLTTKRWELLQALRRLGPVSINALAKHLERDYKNVHGDVKTLEELGLIERTAAGRIEVPWDEIEAHMRLAA